MSAAGTWAVTVTSPMGEQAGTFTVTPNGDRFDGVFDSPFGRFATMDGRIAGDQLSWKLKVAMPLPMTLDCTATVSGDTLSGQIVAGLFGTMTMAGTRG